MIKKINVKYVLIMSASFAGYNIGAGFATGIEPLQYFASWGNPYSFISGITALLLFMLMITFVYITGYEQKFRDIKEVYYYFCGKRLGILFDYYVYLCMFCIVLLMMNGAGATVNQYFGIPEWIGAVIMAVACIIASLFDIDRLMKVLGYLSIFIIAFVICCGVYAFLKNGFHMADPAAVQNYVDEGRMLRAHVFGLRHPVFSALSSAGLLLASGIAWAATTGGLCHSKQEATVAGIMSSIFYYATNMIVVYLVLVSLDFVVDAEVPMLAIVSHYFPALASIYSVIIILAIFSTVSGRLYSLADRYDRNIRSLNIAIVVGTTLFGIVGTMFVQFSTISNILFSAMGAVGIFLGIIVVWKFLKDRQKY